MNFRRRLKRSIAAFGENVLPKAVFEELRNYRAYSGAERSVYLKLRMLEALGMGNRKLPASQACGSVLFVCFGNIIRSPMCEALMLRELESPRQTHIAVSSAGLNATAGRSAHPWAVTAAAREFGISLAEHRARLLTDEMVKQADVIFAMDSQNRIQLLSRWPGATNKVFMLSAYAGERFGAVDIPDPFYLSLEQTRACYRVLSACIQNLVRTLWFDSQVATKETRFDS